MRETIKTCDRCGTVVRHFAITVRDHRAECDASELCDACAEQFKAWVLSYAAKAST